jgi:hypothetical protein
METNMKHPFTDRVTKAPVLNTVRLILTGKQSKLEAMIAAAVRGTAE